MKKFKVVDALDRTQIIEAPSADTAKQLISRNGRRNLYAMTKVGQEDSGKFYLDKGKGPLYPISARAAMNELGMGGFV